MKKISVSSNQSKFVISFPYNAELVSAVKDGFSSPRYDGGTKTWSVPFAQSESIAEFAREHGFELSESAKEKIELLASTRAENLAASRAEVSSLEVAGLQQTLRPFQIAAVAYALKNQRCFLADQMGMGKTIEALATIHAANAYPALIVCPASLKLNWEREARAWLPSDKSINVLNGKSDSECYKADVVILNYDILKKHAEALAAVGFVATIYDESHYCKNHKAQRTQLAQALAKNAKFRLCLTGTPILSRPKELLSQLQLLGRLVDFGGFWDFAKRYCGAYKTKWGWDLSGAQNLDELNDKMRATCYIRRNKADVLKELPAKTRSVIELEIDNSREYQRAERDLIAFLRNESSDNRKFYASIAHLSEEEQRAARHARANSAQNAEHLVKIETLKQLAAQGKLAALYDWVESFLESGESLVLFAHHKSVVDAIAEKFKAPSITGETSLQARQQIVDAFQAGTFKLIVLNIQAGGVGLTLTHSSNVAFAELAWTPAAHDQAEDRCHRIGQTNSVNAWYLLAHGTIDERIYSLIEEKRAVVNAATDGEGESDSAGILNDLIAGLLAE